MQHLSHQQCLYVRDFRKGEALSIESSPNIPLAEPIFSSLKRGQPLITWAEVFYAKCQFQAEVILSFSQNGPLRYMNETREK